MILAFGVTLLLIILVVAGLGMPPLGALPFSLGLLLLGYWGIAGFQLKRWVNLTVLTLGGCLFILGLVVR